MTHPLSVQLYSVRDAFAVDPASTVARLAEIGLETVELFRLLELADVYRVALPDSGMRPSSAHASLLSIDATQLEETFAVAVELGVPVLVDPAVGEGWETIDGVRQLARRLDGVAAAAAEHGLRIGYHNHWWELADLDGRAALEVLADEVDSSVVFEVDTYWAAFGGADVPALLARLGDRAALIHVKDGPVVRDIASQLPAGQGAIDVAAVLSSAPHAIRVLEFDAYAGDIFAGIAESYRYVTDVEGAA